MRPSLCKAGRPSLVIFDCDGVLIDSEGPASRVFAKAMSDIGLLTTAQECRARYTGLSFRDCLTDVESRLGKQVPETWLADLRRNNLAALEQEISAIPFALDAVERVHAAGIALCVASSSNPDYLRKFLGRTGFDLYFGANMFSSKMVARGKPEPDLFLHAIATMNAAPSRTVVIEDSLPGVRAGIAARIRVIGYVGDDGVDSAPLADEGAEIIRDMRQLPALLDLA